MREILFRGQTRRYGEKVDMAGKKLPSNWVYGGIFPQNDDGDFAIIYQMEPEIEKFMVYADTVGQYTGAKDSNGTKIFEGDIIQARYESDAEPPYQPTVWYENYEVYFDDEHCKWRVRSYADVYSLWEFDQDCVVVGNVYDSPELINPYVMAQNE